MRAQPGGREPGTEAEMATDDGGRDGDELLARPRADEVQVEVRMWSQHAAHLGDRAVDLANPVKRVNAVEMVDGFVCQR